MFLLCFDLPQFPLFSSHCRLRHIYSFNLFLLTQETCMPKVPFLTPKQQHLCPFSWDSLRALHELETLPTSRMRDKTLNWLQKFWERGEKLLIITSLMESNRWIHCVKYLSQRRVSQKKSVTNRMKVRAENIEIKLTDLGKSLCIIMPSSKAVVLIQRANTQNRWWGWSFSPLWKETLL